jgi:hypothetical protein
MEMMEALINRSVTCEQKLGYDCKRSRLLNTPVGDSDNFSPYGYWISRCGFYESPPQRFRIIFFNLEDWIKNHEKNLQTKLFSNKYVMIFVAIKISYT